MQDRFKFRVWHKKRQKMYDVLHLHTATWENGGEWVTAKGFNIITQQDIHIQIESKDGILMQCTGLKDKQGKLIYEGDIIYKKGSKNYKNEKMYSRVCWDSMYAQFNISDENGMHQMPSNSNNIEIVGNIYNNPELLEEVK